MTSPRRAPLRPARLVLAAGVVLGSIVAASSGGCTSASQTCDCASPEVTIEIPADIASSIMGVSVSGTACSGVSPTVTNATNGGTAYEFSANAAGDCTIEVDKPSGTFTDTLMFVPGDSCCPGFYVSPSSASTVSVPEPEDGG